MASPTESTSLLSADQRGLQTPEEERAAPAHYRTRVLVIVFVSVIAADFGNALSVAPQLTIYESLICRRRLGYTPTEADGDFCKSPGVQEELAFLTGWKGTFDQIPGLLLVLLYSLAADRIGRKPVLLLALSGLFMEELAIRMLAWISSSSELPLWFIWLTPMFQIIGGGPGTASSMAYSIITDTFPSSQRASVYFYLGAGILVGEILATPLSAFLMSWTPWIPFLAGMGCQVVGIMAALQLPNPKSSTPLILEPDESVNGPTEGAAQHPRRNILQNIAGATSALKLQWDSCRGTIASFKMLCITISFLMVGIASSSLPLITQYASKRFTWSIAKASLLVSIKASINFVCLLFLLPFVSKLLSRRVAPAVTDLRIVQGSALCSTLGLSMMALAAHVGPFIAGIAIMSLGSGYEAALRSLANSLGTESQIGLINGLIGVATNAGTLVAGPSLAAAFKQGMRLGGIWSGLPYLIAAALFFVAACLAWGIKVTGEINDYEEQEE